MGVVEAGGRRLAHSHTSREETSVARVRSRAIAATVYARRDEKGEGEGGAGGKGVEDGVASAVSDLIDVDLKGSADGGKSGLELSIGAVRVCNDLQGAARGDVEVAGVGSVGETP